MALNIPFPGLGYWTKLQHGKRIPSKTHLPDFIGDQTITLHIREDSDLPKISRTGLLKDLQENDSINTTVPEKLTNPDSLIVAVKEDILQRKEQNKNRELVSSSAGFLSITVSHKNLRRAFLFMDTLIKVLKKRGHSVIVDQSKTYFVIEGEKIPIWCREKHTQVLVKGRNRDSHENKPNGLLSLKVDQSYSSTEWVKGKKTLEELLPKILIDLELMGKKLKEKRLDREKYWAEQREKEQKIKDIQDRKEKELKDFLSLLKHAKRHDNAQKIRQYADELEKFYAKDCPLTEESHEKLSWIRRKADWYDPFREAEDKRMEGIDRDELKLWKQSFHWIKDC